MNFFSSEVTVRENESAGAGVGAAGASGRWTWTGLDTRGRPAPAGVYFVRVTDGARRVEVLRMVRIR